LQKFLFSRKKIVPGIVFAKSFHFVKIFGFAYVFANYFCVLEAFRQKINFFK
jgi:hypothetical protein